MDAVTIRLAADGIKVIPEARADSKEFDLAKQWFSSAQRIVFLGFGFDSINCQRLALASVLARRTPITGINHPTIASGYELCDGEIEAARKLLCPTYKWRTEKEQNVEALRRTGALLD